jgi:SPP1 family predicted phage head-tail adaptor
MSDPTIGALRQRITLEAPSRIEGEGGTAEISWSAVLDVWARIVPSAGRELVRSDGMTARLTHEIVLRHRSGVLPEMRFRQGTRLFQIHAVIDVSERRRWLRCLCEEYLP